MSAPRWAAVIVAAGNGTRMGGPKQLRDIAGTPLVGWCMRTFAAMAEIADVAVVTETRWIAAMRALAERTFARDVAVVAGGDSRQESVLRGLEALGGVADAVLVHDGARPLVCASDVRAAMAPVRSGRATVLAAPVVDTIKTVEDATMRVTRTLDRATLWAAQTPQCAMLDDLLRAHKDALAAGAQATDDAALLERIGVEVIVVPATRANFKVTLPDDVARAEAALQDRRAEAAR